jgi:copper chaperone CopZ
MVARTQISLPMNLRKQGALLMVLLMTALGLAQRPAQKEQGTQKWTPIHIEKNLPSETGVSDAVVSYESRTAKILYDPSSIIMASIQKTITGTKVKDYGYRIAEVTYLNQE